MREHGGSETSDDTRPKGDSEVLCVGQVRLGLGGHLFVDEFGASLVDSELT